LYECLFLLHFLSGEVTYKGNNIDILFLGNDAVLPTKAMNKNYITDFGVLRSMGDRLVGNLARNIGAGSGTEVDKDGSNGMYFGFCYLSYWSLFVANCVQIPMLVIKPTRMRMGMLLGWE
jgi:hypothetical protein